MEAAIRTLLFLSFIASLIVLFSCLQNGSSRQFPSDFIFGTGTSSYQTEGAWNEEGKGLSNLDDAVHSHPERVKDGSNGDVTCDSYHLWEIDIEMLKYLEVKAYKFSISWPRIIPSGFSNYVNPAGIRYYSNLIDELVKNGIEPVVVIYHVETPIDLSLVGGWSNELIVDFFTDYALILFKNYGDRVNKWITFNEPVGICTQAALLESKVFEHTRYYCGQNVLLAHAKVYHEYRKKFYPHQKGKIGMSFETFWHKPNSPSKQDQQAAARGWAFNFGWFTHPILSTTGDYHPEIKTRINYLSQRQQSQRSRLPRLSLDQIKDIRGTLDFVGVNYYTTKLATAINDSNLISWENDVGAKVGFDLSHTTSDDYLPSNPDGLEEVLKFIREEYDNPDVYITENGFAASEMEDTKRINYFKDHLDVVLNALEYGSNIKGYFTWSLMDNWEWFGGFTVKFGLFHVDFNNANRTRTARKSAAWYREVVKTHQLTYEL